MCSCEYKFGVIFDQVLTDRFGGHRELVKDGGAGKQPDVVELADLLSQLGEDLFFNGIDSFGNLDLDYYLLSFAHEERLDNQCDAFAQIPLRSVH